LGRPEGKRILEELGMDGKIILQWILRKQCEGVHWIHRAQDTNQDGFIQNSAMKCGEFLDKLSDCQLVKKGCAPWS
jgi:hypothetical protein